MFFASANGIIKSRVANYHHIYNHSTELPNKSKISGRCKRMSLHLFLYTKKGVKRVESKKKTKTAIIILAVLLGISLAALGVTLIYRAGSSKGRSEVTVPGNLISPTEKESSTAITDGIYNNEGNADTPNTEKPSGDSGKSQADEASGQTVQTSQTVQTGAETSDSTAAETKKAATIELYDKHPDDNTRFNVTNMFPGDAETKYFCVKVSYHDKVTVHYKATVREGYEKLAEVLKVKVKLLTTGETMYDGLMKDMPKSVTYKLSSAESTTTELYYEITAYLDTSVGNEYQNKELVADFSWWVEETGNLEPSPKTGDNSHILLFATLAAVSAFILIFLLFIRKRRKEEEENV